MFRISIPNIINAENGSRAPQPATQPMDFEMTASNGQAVKLYDDTPGHGFENAPFLEFEAGKGLSLLNSWSPQARADAKSETSATELATPEATPTSTPENAANKKSPYNDLHLICEGGYRKLDRSSGFIGPLHAPYQINNTKQQPTLRNVREWRQARRMGQLRNASSRQIINKVPPIAKIEMYQRQNTAEHPTGCYLKRQHDEYLETIQTTGELPIPGQEKATYTTDAITCQVRKRRKIDDDIKQQSKRVKRDLVEKYYKKIREEREEADESGTDSETGTELPTPMVYAHNEELSEQLLNNVAEDLEDIDLGKPDELEEALSDAIDRSIEIAAVEMELRAAIQLGLEAMARREREKGQQQIESEED